MPVVVNQQCRKVQVWVKVRFSVPNLHGVIGIRLNGARVSVRVSAGHVGRLGSVARVLVPGLVGLRWNKYMRVVYCQFSTVANNVGVRIWDAKPDHYLIHTTMQLMARI